MKRAVDQKITPNKIRKLMPVNPAYMSARRKLDVRNTLLWGTESVAGAAHGMNQSVRIAAVYLAAQTAHVSLHDAGIRVEMHAPDILQQHGAGDDLLGMSHQIFEQQKFTRQQIDRYTAAQNGARQQIHL